MSDSFYFKTEHRSPSDFLLRSKTHCVTSFISLSLYYNDICYLYAYPERSGVAAGSEVTPGSIESHDQQVETGVTPVDWIKNLHQHGSSWMTMVITLL